MFNLENIKINSYDLSFSTYYVNIKSNKKIYNNIKLFEYYILVYLYDYINKYNKKFLFNELENNKISNIIDTDANDLCKLDIKIYSPSFVLAAHQILKFLNFFFKNFLYLYFIILNT